MLAKLFLVFMRTGGWQLSVVAGALQRGESLLGVEGCLRRPRVNYCLSMRVWSISVSSSIFVSIAVSLSFVRSSDSRTGSASEASLCCASASLATSAMAMLNQRLINAIYCLKVRAHLASADLMLTWCFLMFS